MGLWYGMGSEEGKAARAAAEKCLFSNSFREKMEFMYCHILGTGRGSYSPLSVLNFQPLMGIFQNLYCSSWGHAVCPTECVRCLCMQMFMNSNSAKYRKAHHTTSCSISVTMFITAFTQHSLPVCTVWSGF
ncbi:hypothetical protein CDAR_59711 [Caerostris darwini]|uniref:Uncharacterized protein n=1 Tax=Caerostris darwini TaxID=1538125 RepID=A0AAV4RRD2_9ARAC|nr:hypothetical protein CDAR_59711 [Caerostris darwini]